MSSIKEPIVLKLTKEQYEGLLMERILAADIIIVDDYLLKNKFGPEKCPFTGIFGICDKCKKEIKERTLAFTTFIGCMC
jgi:hypothetical protein